LLTELRRVGDVVGPPMPLKREGDWWRSLRRDVVAIARGAGLLRRRYPSGLFLTAVVALAVTTVPLYARSPEALVGGVVGATILAPSVATIRPVAWRRRRSTASTSRVRT